MQPLLARSSLPSQDSSGLALLSWVHAHRGQYFSQGVF